MNQLQKTKTFIIWNIKANIQKHWQIIFLILKYNLSVIIKRKF